MKMFRPNEASTAMVKPHTKRTKAGQQRAEFERVQETAAELIELSKVEVERARTLLDDTAKHVLRRRKAEPRER
jgi:hypothetical protein